VADDSQNLFRLPSFFFQNGVAAWKIAVRQIGKATAAVAVGRR
jgi:hypothetical protein